VYWKPVQSGTDGQTDRHWVQSHTGLGEDHFPPEAYLLRTPVSPHLAAAIEGTTIDPARIIPPPLPPGKSPLIIEGAGGVMAPLNETRFMIDLFSRLNAPVLVVAPSRVGMINHTLLTVEQLRRYHIPVFGVVMNGPRNEENQKAVEHYGRVPVLAQIPPLPEINPEALRHAFVAHFLKGQTL
jgi:dethiobiotin synthase